MEATKMRKMMVAASLLVAGCGSELGGEDEATCTSAEQCDPGTACDVTANECVTGVLTIEPTAEVAVDGARWWTAVTDPIVTGTFVGGAGTTIEVSVGGAAPIVATLQGDTWTAKLPGDAIGASDTEVLVTMRDGAGRLVELTQLFVLDAAAPQISLATSKLRDERGDTIEFSTGEPVHTHEGAEIDLAGDGCPAVYKYAYLTDEAPAFGRQTTQNPLAWSFAIADAKLTDTRYRVRDASDQILIDWTALAPTNGVYRVELGRSALPVLGTYAGQLSVDVLARDWTGREATRTACIEYYPLAAPLAIHAPRPAPPPNGPAPSLFEMSMAAGSEMSVLAGHGLGAAVVSQRIVQYTAEPIMLTYSLAPGAMRFSRTYVDDFVAVATTPLSNTTCDQIDCSAAAPADPADSVTSGSTSSYQWTLVLIDEATNQPLPNASSPRIPARGANEPPRAYRLVAYLGQLADLRVTPGMVPAEYALNNLTYTGYAPFDEQTRCTATATRCRFEVCVELCTQSTTYKRIVALDRATLEIDGGWIALRASTVPLEAGALPGLPTSTFAMGAMVWDSGDDDLPGAH
jgi:hypothetical protein